MQKVIHSPERIKHVLDQCQTKEELLKYINKVDKHGDTLVHFAARSHSLDVLHILKEYGADFTIFNKHGRQPLHEAIDSAECVSFIVNNCNIDINALKRGNWSASMTAALKGRLDIIQILEKAGANLDLCNKDGRTALHLAIQHGHVETSKYLAQRSPSSITKPTKSGRLPIQIAAALINEDEEGQDHPKLLQDISYDITTFLFLDHVKTSLAHRDNSGRGLLQDAAVSQNLRLVRFLITQGADPNQVDTIGRNVIHHAAMLGHLDLLELLYSMEHSSDRKEEEVQVEQVTGKENNSNMNKKGGIVLNWDLSDKWDEWTPLMHAARQGHFPIVQFLVRHGLALKNGRDKQGRTAKDLAGIWNHHDIVNYLQ